MRIGLSFSRCVLDIVEGRVNIDDVLVIVARTDFNPTDDRQWSGIWYGYTGFNSLSNPEWASYEADNKDHEDKFRSVSLMLYNDGKLHQPRQFGAHARRRPEFWLETILPSEELENNPAVKKAWDNFQVIAGLSSIELNKDYQ